MIDYSKRFFEIMEDFVPLNQQQGKVRKELLEYWSIVADRMDALVESIEESEDAMLPEEPERPWPSKTKS